MTTAGDVRRSSRRIGLYTAGLVAGAMLLMGTFVFTEFQRSVRSFGIEQMRSTARHVTDPEDAPSGVFLVVIKERTGYRKTSMGIPDGLPYEKDLRATQRDHLTRERELMLPSGQTFVLRTQATHRSITQAMFSLSTHRGDIDSLRNTLIGGGALGVVIAALIGVALARRTLLPLVETVDLQRRFVADASHELRTPLTLLSTRAQLLARRMRVSGSAEFADELHGVVGDANRLADILDDLLIAADPREAGDSEPVDLRAVADDVVASAQAGADRRGIDVRVDGPEAWVLGTPTSLRRAVLALVDNALSHADAAVVVHIVDGRTCRVDVTDDGRGIEPDALPRIFERFTSADTTREDRRHYGLGLALVAEVAAAHGGRVEAANPPDGGAMVSLLIPQMRD